MISRIMEAYFLLGVLRILVVVRSQDISDDGHTYMNPRDKVDKVGFEVYGFIRVVYVSQFNFFFLEARPSLRVHEPSLSLSA